MDGLLNQVARFNRWYDGLREPGRFLLFMALMVISVFSLQLGLAAHGKYPLLEKVLVPVGLINTLIVVFIATVRATGMGGKHRIIAKVMLAVTLLIILAVGLLYIL